jgi:hypothetical protein
LNAGLGQRRHSGIRMKAALLKKTGPPRGGGRILPTFSHSEAIADFSKLEIHKAA